MKRASEERFGSGIACPRRMALNALPKVAYSTELSTAATERVTTFTRNFDRRLTDAG
jgi:hypothetical protein